MNNNWTKFSIKEIVDTNDRYSLIGGPFGSDLKSSEYTNKGIRIIQLQNIGDGEFIDNYKIYTSQGKADSLSSCKIYSGEIILSKMGDPVARATLIPEHLKTCLMSSDGIRLKVDEKRFDKKFILEKINSPSFRTQAETVSKGTTRKRIGLQNLKELTINIPPLPEQKKVGDMLSKLDYLIYIYKSKLKKLDFLKESILFDYLFNNRNDCKIKSIGEVTNLSQGIQVGIELHQEKLDSGKVRFLRISDYTKTAEIPRYIDKKLATKGIIKHDDIVMIRYGESGKVYRGLEGAIANNLFKITPTHDMNKDFMFYQLSSSFIQEEIKKNSASTTMPAINFTSLNNIKLRIPKINEQNKISSILLKTEKTIYKTKQVLSQIILLKRSLCNELLSGRNRLKIWKCQVKNFIR